MSQLKHRLLFDKVIAACLPREVSGRLANSSRPESGAPTAIRLEHRLHAVLSENVPTMLDRGPTKAVV